MKSINFETKIDEKTGLAICPDCGNLQYPGESSCPLPTMSRDIMNALAEDAKDQQNARDLRLLEWALATPREEVEAMINRLKKVVKL